MKNQIMSTSLIVLFVVLFFASNGGLLVEAIITQCRSKVAVLNCTRTDCEKLCDHDYSNNLGRARGTCADNVRCICVYPSFNGRCFAKHHLT
ncbi:hypothetical protein HN51_015075 [Arachis hypogaea]